MKKLVKMLSLMMAVMLFTGMLAACSGKTGGKAGKVDVGIVLPTKDEPRWVQDEQRFKDALKGSDYTTEILFSQGSSAKEKENVETLINKGIKVLIICPQDGDAAAAAVEAAKKEKITVISYDRLITHTDAVDYYVTFDSVAVGAAQGQYLIDHVKGKDMPLYLYAGAASDNNAFLFFQGAWSVLQPKIADGTFKVANSSAAEGLKEKQELSREELSKILGQVTTNWDANDAKNKAQTHLTAASAALKGDVAVLAPNDGTARSIADVFASDGDIKSYVVTGQDAEKASIQYVIDSKQSMTVFKDVRTLVKDAMGMAVTILDGKKPETTGTYDNGKIKVNAKQTNVIVVDKENVKKELIDSDYYKASDFKGL
ncbi:sugar ABC transporter substrate-binding protein [Neobacillus vireti]|uniref:Sugar uptake ABC transporter periplasmic solute-binding protein n=1 Tax=Neobacillus vireti LMG 21834 TaxID=1131730 RepID=A0AB94IT61_9BACI|nr:sugar-binding protein [Neobacillus vireti]ETI70187.1 sugar uptake ABC transporter periplasmic solute-binding protein [Neobacillus vireti LMG 21834]KLT16447.1 sugar ABC transporter substrate-binding protein [Neobacillus vireti]